ncbi:MAG: hypothetical protein JRH20_05265 [Deltaproteobacteria bacterium]|nr:hypothetical protein [Deltaproteobacteria bacterium]
MRRWIDTTGSSVLVELGPVLLRALEKDLAADIFWRAETFLRNYCSTETSDLPRSVQRELLRHVLSRVRTWGQVEDWIANYSHASKSEQARQEKELLHEESRDFSQVHSVLVFALRETPQDLVPQRAFHHGCARPSVGGPPFVDMVLSLAETFEDLVVEHEHEVLLQLNGEEGKTLNIDNEWSPALRLNYALLKEKTLCATGAHDMLGTSTRTACASVIRWLLAHDQHTRIPDFLMKIDDGLCTAEVKKHLKMRKQTPSMAVRRCIWRAGTTKKVCLWVAEMAEERWGMLYKPKRRWTWLEGTPDDVVASIPDDLFESAVPALFPETH